MRIFGTFLLAVLILLSAGTLFTVGAISDFTCADCGMIRERTQFPWSTTDRIERTGRTNWYDRRVGAAHEHRWIPAACSTGLNVWKARTTFFYSASEPLASDSGSLGRVLEFLEPLNLDVAFHHHLAHGDRRHRIAAAQAAEAVSLGGHYTSLLEWWPKASAYLSDSSLWSQTYRQWAYPALPARWRWD